MRIQKHTGRVVLGILGLVILAGIQDVLAQGFPTDSRTMVDAKAAIKTATVEKATFTSGWKLERERGFLYDNLAKRAIEMVVKDNSSGDKRSFEGLAIYQRSSAAAPWVFSRFFTYTNSIKMLGGKEDTAMLKQLALDGMKANPAEWFGDTSGIFWVYPIEVVPGSYRKESDRAMSFEVKFDMELRWDYKYLVHRNQILKIDGYLGQDGKTWTLDPGNGGQKEIKRQEMKPSDLDAMPNMSKKGFTALYGEKAGGTK